MRIDVAFAPSLIPETQVLERSIVVVVDVLRASSTMCALLSHGARKLQLCASTEHALELKSQPSYQQFLLAGEKHGFKPEGFDIGNSPIVQSEVVRGRDILYATTNGTTMLRRTSDAPIQCVSTFVNLRATLNYIEKLSVQNTMLDSLIICCSGSYGSICLEDSFFAGAFIAGYIARGNSHELTDAAYAAICIVNSYNNHIRDMFRNAVHAQYLTENGFAHDVEFCATTDLFDVVPLCRNGVVTKSL